MDVAAGAVDGVASPAAAAEVDAIGESTAAGSGSIVDPAIFNKRESIAMRWAQTSRCANMDLLALSEELGLSVIL